ncbi:MAG TPA: hypothetical protein VL068_00610 [Microthrixaceae bacterium]|nr:hypothetical protein [Microthrixaceae bacterium]
MSMTPNRLELMVTDVWNRPDRFVDPSNTEDEFEDSPDEDDSQDDSNFPGGRELLIAVDGTLVLQAWGGLGVDLGADCSAPDR